MVIWDQVNWLDYQIENPECANAEHFNAAIWELNQIKHLVGIQIALRHLAFIDTNMLCEAEEIVAEGEVKQKQQKELEAGS